MRTTATVTLSIAPSDRARLTSRRAARSAFRESLSTAWIASGGTWFDSPSEQANNQSPGSRATE